MFKNFIQKIKFFFSKIFGKNNLLLKESESQTVSDSESISENNDVDKKSLNTIEVLKEQNRQNKTIDEIISLVERNPKVMVNLNDDQLDVIDNYYIKANNRIKKEIDIIDEKINSITEYIEQMNEKISNMNVDNN